MGKPNDVKKAATGRHDYAVNEPDWGGSDMVNDNDNSGDSLGENKGEKDK